MGNHEIFKLGRKIRLQGMIETDGKAILIFDVTAEETDVSLDKDDDEE